MKRQINSIPNPFQPEPKATSSKAVSLNDFLPKHHPPNQQGLIQSTPKLF